MNGADYGPWEVAGYQLRIDVQNGVRLVAARNGELVRGLPRPVRESGEMAWIRLVVEAAAHTRRAMRAVLEHAMVEAIPLSALDLQLMEGDPLGRALLSALLVDCDGVIGRPLLEERGLETPHGDLPGLAAPLKVIHPLRLAEAGTLLFWRSWLDRVWLRQPFKQIRREIALPDARDAECGTYTARVAGARVRWDQARALLEGRGWYRVTKMGAERNFPSARLTAHLEFDASAPGRRGRDAVLIGRLYFLPRGELPTSRAQPGVPLREVCAVVFSEAVRDAALVANVAGRVSGDGEF